MKLIHRYCFGEYISYLITGRNMNWFTLANFELVSDVMAINLNMLSALMKDRIANDLKSSLVLTVELHRQETLNIQIL